MSSQKIAVSRRVRRTPFTPRVDAAGVTGYTVYNHMLLATIFESLEADCAHLKQHVQLWDVSCERQVELRGPDAARLAQLMTPRNLSKAKIGQCVYAPMTDAEGRMINDPVVLKLAEDHFWFSIADSDVLLWALGLATGYGLDVAIQEPGVYPLAVQGPKADDLMASLFGEAVREIRFFRFAYLEFQGHPLLIARSGWSKQGGFEIYLDREDLALPLWDALWDAGQAFGVRAGCPNQIERLEGGLLSYGNDFNRADNALEVGLERFCDLDSPIEFLGRDALRRVRDAGVTRRLRGLRFVGTSYTVSLGDWPVRSHDGAVLGEITSGVYSPSLASYIAFAMIDRSAWDTGTEVIVACPDGDQPAKVCDLPFVT